MRDGLYTIKITPNYDPHVVDLANHDATARTLEDVESGRDASIFGGVFGRPFRIELVGLGLGTYLYGDDDTIRQLADAAGLLVGSGLDAEQQRVVWQAATTDTGEIYARTDELIYDFENEDEEGMQANPRQLRSAARISRGR